MEGGSVPVLYRSSRVCEQILPRTRGMVVQRLRRGDGVRGVLVLGGGFYLAGSFGASGCILGFWDYLFLGVSPVVASFSFRSRPIVVCRTCPHRDILYVVGFSVLRRRLRDRVGLDSVS